MKSILVLAAAFALSATAASAECIGHSKTVSADQVDKELTTASVTRAEQPVSDDLLLQQKLRPEDRATEE